MKVVIFSDIHDSKSNLLKFIKRLEKENVDLGLFAGDLISPLMIGILAELKFPIKMIWGNNEGEKLGVSKQISNHEDKLSMEGDSWEGEVGGKHVFMTHYPNIAELASKSQLYDLVIYGHTHKFQHVQEGETVVINPGEIAGLLGDASFVLWDTSANTFTQIIV